MRTSAAFSLHLHDHDIATKSGDIEGIGRATSALQSITGILIYATRASFQGRPMDSDAVSFWAHRIIALAALMQIRFGERNDDWSDDMEVLKRYLRYYAPRYKLYGMLLLLDLGDSDEAYLFLQPIICRRSRKPRS